MRVLPIIMVGSSVLSTSFAQQYRARSSSMCSTADQHSCCEMMLGSLEAEGARHFCIEHGCNFSICSGKPSGSDVGVKMDDADDMDEDHDHDTDIDLWGSGGATQWGKSEDEYDAFASGVNKWSKDEDEVDSDRDGAASASAILPSRSRQRKQRGLAWSPPNWGAPKYTDPKPYYRPPANNYYPPSAPTPYYPAAPEFVETCCSSNERVCPMDFPMQKQVLLSGKVRVCCFTSRVNGGGGYYPHSYGYGGGGYYRGGGGGYQAQTSPRYGGGYGNRKLQYGYAYGRGGTYGQQPSYYGDSYAYGGGLPAQCPATPLPTPVPSPAPSISSQPSACFDKKLWTFEPPDNAFPNPPDWTNGDCRDLSTNLVVPCVNKNWKIASDQKDTGSFSLKSPSLDALGIAQPQTTKRASARLTLCPTSPARALRLRVFPGAVRPFDRLVVLVDGVFAFQVRDANKVGEEWITVPSAGGFALTAGGHTIDFMYEYNPFKEDLSMVPFDPDRDGAVWIDNVELL